MPGIEWILAYALLAKLDTVAPQFVRPYPERDACMVEAEKRNRTTPELQTPEVRALGGEFVCLKVVRAGT